VAEAIGILLAAGAGRRYGGPKALVELDGRLLVERAIATLADGGCDSILVILGAAADEVRARADLGSSTAVDNPDWATGMGSSLRTGLAAAAATTAEAAVVLLVDTPGVTPAAVRRLRTLAAPDALAIATYGGQPGHPVLLGRAHWSDAARLAVGDVGARRYLAAHDDQVNHVPCDDIADGADMDVPPPAPQPSA
jgi:CTP:molybdopterin cytidylyltransferase MocA